MTSERVCLDIWDYRIGVGFSLGRKWDGSKTQHMPRFCTEINLYCLIYYREIQISLKASSRLVLLSYCKCGLRRYCEGRREKEKLMDLRHFKTVKSMCVTITEPKCHNEAVTKKEKKIQQGPNMNSNWFFKNSLKRDSTIKTMCGVWKKRKTWLTKILMSSQKFKITPTYQPFSMYIFRMILEHVVQCLMCLEKEHE